MGTKKTNFLKCCLKKMKPYFSNLKLRLKMEEKKKVSNTKQQIKGFDYVTNGCLDIFHQCQRKVFISSPKIVV